MYFAGNYEKLQKTFRDFLFIIRIILIIISITDNRHIIGVYEEIIPPTEPMTNKPNPISAQKSTIE